MIGESAEQYARPGTNSGSETTAGARSSVVTLSYVRHRGNEYVHVKKLIELLRDEGESRAAEIIEANSRGEITRIWKERS